MKEKKSVEKKEYGIKETEDVLSLVFALGKVVKESAKDGFDTADIARLVSIIPHIAPAFEGAGNVPNEIKDLSKDEVKKLLIFSANHLGSFAGDNEKLANQVEKGLSAALAILEFIKVL